MFDEVIDRRSQASKKWHQVPMGVQSMWLADMDFRSPQPILNSLSKMLEHGILGYPTLTENFYLAIMRWYKKNHGLILAKHNIIAVTGVLPAIRALIEELCDQNDSIILQPPVYDHFFELVKESGRRIVRNPLRIDKTGRYHFDFEQLELCLKAKPRLLLLCSPHNPVSRVWDPRELAALIQRCQKANVIVIVDEIHSDLTLKPHKFYSVAKLPDIDQQKIIVLNSPTKAFNVAGIRGGYVILFNDEWHRQFQRRFTRYGVDKINLFFLEASISAYTECDLWLKECRRYIESNRAWVVNFCAKEFPLLKATPLEATYLMWFNYKRLHIDEAGLLAKTKKYLTLSPASVFGVKDCYFRLNIACPHSTLVSAMENLKRSLQED